MSSANIRVKKRNLPSEWLQELVRDNFVTHKLVLSTCKSLAKEHVLLRYDFAGQKFEAMALAPISLNGSLVDHTNGFLTVRANDQIEFPCTRCYTPHLFYITLPNITVAKKKQTESGAKTSSSLTAE